MYPGILESQKMKGYRSSRIRDSFAALENKPSFGK
jgi:hypothetical protein